MRFILGVESSCDDAALAFLDTQKGFLGEWVHSQTALHQQYGGVVPDLASREHMLWLPALLEKACLEKQQPDVIAVTVGPGLPGSLGVGIAFAQALSWVLKIPIQPVNHLHGHALSPFIGLYEKQLSSEFYGILKSYLPHLGLLVSGSNTLLFLLDEDFKFQILAQTVDDAAGEALDKGAKLLGMPYPGGPLIERHAALGNAKAYAFPRAFLQKNEWKFSFSGLKTSLRYQLERISDSDFEQQLSDLCASYQEAIIDILIKKTHQALQSYPVKSMGLSGGVANNGLLRERFQSLSQLFSMPLFLAHKSHTGDNAAMIAFAAWLGSWNVGFQQSLFPFQFYSQLALD
jgi:N6-L-threonylcarbamoyladenine synthase